ncbi:translation initiation factor IF-2 [Halodesulfovibrio sp.]|jgi:translation initiation factor IF-2|uniref:translation initiation factor IF-2 n=1 Tax=Halodesulfovibrio sp. TaxID=1912772 RepID=UPI0025D02122|nr:translation initiation factor IF-2 [Halodesulfovibrio sp.]MCT4536388.1 translation initiation factor IF-2 [Halodesulfovibrio sp.]
MSDKKIKVKELKTELDVPTKDILSALRELGVSAKSGETSIPTEMIEQVRDHIKNGPAKKEVMRKETSSGVIVRRRKKAAKTADAKPAEEKQAAEAEKVQKEVKEAPAKKEAPKAKIVTPKKETKAAPAAESAKPAKKEAPKVRVVKPEELAKQEAKKKTADTPQPSVKADAPKKEQKPAPEVKKEAAPKAEAKQTAKVVKAEKVEKAEKAEAAPKKDAPAKAAAKDKAETPADADGAKKKKKPAKKREEAPAAPQVRIISRPDPAVAAAEAREREQRAARPQQRRDDRGGRPNGGRPGGGGGRPNGGRPGGQGGRPGGGQGRPGGGGGRPGGQGRPGGGGGRPAPNFADAPASPDKPATRNKKYSKNKRTVDFNQRDGFDKKKRSKDAAFTSDEWKRSKRKRKKQEQTPSSTQPLKAAKRKIKVDDHIRVSDLAHQMGIKGSEIIKVLMQLGVMATINQSLDFDTAVVVAGEFKYEIEKVGFSEEDYLTPREEDKAEDLHIRPPVVTIMGHVDHGKTSLLDAIRKSSITDREAGGITQHIGAYHVVTPNGDLCFLDTPGHEAFTAMRARGAKVTDIVILVVAADDGVMEQTREAVAHAKAAEVPIIVAVNKMDKEGANPERVMRELSEIGLVTEDWGGDTIFANVSAKTGMGLDDLLEILALQAEVLELKANPNKPARGHIVEAKLDKGRGPVATVLVQEGTLKQGDIFVCGTFSGRVRAMFNDQGKKVQAAGPSTPVEVQGFDGVPEAGEEFVALSDEKVARRIADQRSIKERERALARESKVTLETFLASRADAEEAQVLNVVLKADVQGSVEAIVDALKKQATEKVKVDVIHSGAGSITESDILLASASNAVIIGFNVRPTVKVKEVAEQEGVDIRFYDIIYKLVEEVRAAMAGILAPIVKEQYLGQATVRETFSVPKIGVIAGCHVDDGKITRNAGVRLLRDGVVIYTGTISSLKRFKDDAKEVLKGYECGIGLDRFNDIKIGDAIEAFEEVEEAATL